MSASYDIQRWDSVYNKNPKSVTMSPTLPAIYISPDSTILKSIRASNFEIPIKITGTNSPYDNILAIAKCQPAQDTAGYRPNFQAATNYIVLVPDTRWEGYPRELGQVHILIENSKDSNNSTIDTINNKINEYYNKLTEDPNTVITLQCCIVAILFILFLLIIQCKENTKQYI
jgi:hypothetical protein